MENLQQIADLIGQCTDCNLHRSRLNVVPGEGVSNAEIMFIGEGPGQNEDRQGRPFVGAAGNLLDEMLESIGLNRGSVYIANMVKCRPPGNRDPLPDEILSCSKYLDRQIEVIDPLVIVTLGRFSLGKFFPGEGISKARGSLRYYEGRPIYPMLHPAAALYRRELKGTIYQDFKALPDILNNLRRSRMIEPQTDHPQINIEEPPTQMTLF
ncbi:MAG: uracil-DNA glycosylase [Dehalococcoidia bacterium]|nr:uracil-DNA glycosylase [Dehalococcoidia bacterium]